MGIVVTMVVERAVRKGQQPPWIGALIHSATGDAASYGVVDEIAGAFGSAEAGCWLPP
jgi:hypothetical protein